MSLSSLVRSLVLVGFMASCEPTSPLQRVPEIPAPSNPIVSTPAGTRYVEEVPCLKEYSAGCSLSGVYGAVNLDEFNDCVDIASGGDFEIMEWAYFSLRNY